MSDEVILTLAVEDDSLNADELENLLLDLKAEIEDASKHVLQPSEEKEQRDNTLGAALLPILTVVLASPVAVKLAEGLVTIIRDWLRGKKTVRVAIKGKEDAVISSENLSDEELAKVVSELL